MKIIKQMTDSGLTVSHSEARHLICMGRVKLNGKWLNPSGTWDKEVKPGDLIEVGQKQITVPADEPKDDS